MMDNFSSTASFLWSVADLLRGDFKQSQYGRIILLFTLLRRLECVLEATKPNVLDKYESVKDKPVEVQEKILIHAANLKQREVDLELGHKIGEEEPSYLSPTKEYSGATPKEAKTDLLNEIISRMNDLFIEEDLSEGDLINYANTIAGKISESETVMEQLQNNTKEQAMLGKFPESINNTVIESMGVHEGMAMKVLSNAAVAKGFAELMFDVLVKGVGNNRSSSDRRI